MHIGKRIRELRKAKDVTLIELAEKTGVAQATLSRIETGVMTGTVDSHKRIADALGITVAELYQELDDRKEKTALQRGEPLKAELRPSQKIQVELLTQDVLRKKMTPLLVSMSPKTRMKSEQCERGVEKFIYVIEGSIEVLLDKDTYALKKQDALYFDASLKHTISNPNSQKARFFSVASPPRI